MRAITRVILVISMSLACAVESPPPGGPIDDVAPGVVGTTPKSDSAGVDPGTAIAITFDEDMTRTGLERLFSMLPEIEIGTVRWKGRTVIIQPLDSLHPDTTYIVTLKPGYRDNHKVPNKDKYWWAFATSAAIDSGTIAGTVLFRREPTPNAVARCFRLPVDSGFVAQASRPDREALADEAGKYKLRYLPNRDSRFIVWAFEDKNGNGVFEPENEYGATFADTVDLRPAEPFASGVNISIVDPTEPALVAGVVVNRSGIDTLAVTVTLTPDTAQTPSYVALCDTAGVFAFKSVKMGAYIVRAMVEVVPDSVCSWYPCFDDTTMMCAEPCAVMPDTLTVEPGDEVQIDSLYLDPAGRREKDNP
jgi:hypothetical protein